MSFFLTPMYMYMCLLNAVHASLSLSYVRASKCEVYDFCFCVGIVRYSCYHWIFHCSRATLGAERVSGESTCTCASPYQPPILVFLFSSDFLGDCGWSQSCLWCAGGSAPLCCIAVILISVSTVHASYIILYTC